MASYSMGRSFFLCVLVFVIFSLAVAGQKNKTDQQTPAQAKSTALQLEPCRLANMTEEVKCGKLEVFENRETKSGRKISISVVVLPALTDKPAADPVFFLAGGPGQSIISVMPAARKDLLSKIRKERAVVLVDQRGTGASNPLNCTLYGDVKNMSVFFGDPFPADTLRACRENLEKVADLTQYTTTIAMDDLDDVRAALGYDKINIHGGSYGTTAALVYLRSHGNHVRTVTLESVAPVDWKNPLPVPKALQHAMDRLFSDCAADEKCNAAYPRLQSEYKEILARLAKAPVTTDATNPLTQVRQQVTIDRNAFVGLMRVMLYDPSVATYLPIVIHLAYLGNFESFARVAYLYSRALEDQLARGLYLSVSCAEGTQFITEADIARETAQTDLGDVSIRRVMKACQDWPKAKVSASFLEPVKSNVPVLIISGDLDPVTQPYVATAAAKYLSNSRQIIIKNASHTPATDCTFNLESEFISKGTAKDLDASCVDQIKRPPFYVP
ncbi:MAG TPA: alpha/beta fold hydrolase [Blastocatellia bacterium]|nr:alpha/beta fold hydrolase [Blastocatellia bacterium]